jgi:hypothetical protein
MTRSWSMLAATLLAVAAGCMTVAAGKPAAPGHAGVREPLIRGYGIRLTVPPGWHARIYRRPPEGGPPAPVVQLATTRLGLDDDVGTATARRMDPGDILIVLLETHCTGRSGTLWPPIAAPPTIRRVDLQTSWEGVSASHAFAWRTFALYGRAFALWVQFGQKPALRRQVHNANVALSHIHIARRHAGLSPPGCYASVGG